MPYVYILHSEKYDRYYIGCANDLDRRLLRHQSGLVKSTKYLLPIRLVFSKKYETLTEARRIESKLKGFKSRAIIERILKDGTIKTDGAVVQLEER